MITEDAKKAMLDLAAKLRTVPAELWTFDEVGGLMHKEETAGCRTFGCALGHSVNIPSCVALLNKHGLSGLSEYVDIALLREGVDPDAVQGIFYEYSFHKKKRSEDISAVEVAEALERLAQLGDKTAVELTRKG